MQGCSTGSRDRNLEDDGSCATWADDAAEVRVGVSVRLRSYEGPIWADPRQLYPAGVVGEEISFPTVFSPGSSALSSVFASVLAVVSSVFASVVAAVHAVGDDGRSADNGCRARHGGANDASAGGAGWS